jgi:fructan beta-fructosidase
MPTVRLSACVLMLAFAAAAQTPPKPPDSFYDITLEDLTGQRHYHHPLRPQLHYTPLQGHIGDATGLFYYAGEYHLFYMYDQWSRRRLAHKQWGHAVSPDLIHWTELAPVLDKLIDNSPGSGSGVVDWNDSAGLRRGAPDKTVLIFYTDYKRGTGIAYSRDRGRTWTRHPKNAVIAGADDARDPTVFWHPPTAGWRMVRYEKKGFAFYKSRNLVEWTWLSRLEDFYECPDIMRLPVLNSPGERRWVLIDGNGAYVIGDFDGDRFTPRTPKLKSEYGRALYAPQTWKRTLEGDAPIIQVAWTRYPDNPRLAWHGQTSFPVELTLWDFPDGPRVCRKPVDELDNLRVSQQRWSGVTIGPGERPFPEIKPGLLDLQVELETAGAASYGLNAGGHEIRYSPAEQTLRVNQTTAPLPLAGGRLKLRILLDRSSIEVFADRGQVTVADVKLEAHAGAPVTFLSAGGQVRVVSLEANRLESIWQGRP